jgi:serine O-acetyltransferase
MFLVFRCKIPGTQGAHCLRGSGAIRSGTEESALGKRRHVRPSVALDISASHGVGRLAQSPHHFHAADPAVGPVEVAQMSIRFFVDDLRSASKSDSILVNLKWFVFTHSLHMLFMLRLGQSLRTVPLLGRVLGFVIEYLIRVIYASDISCLACIGRGFVIVHGHDIVIGADVRIGERCKIFNGVTLGNKDTDQTSKGNQPFLGHDVTISTGAKLLGPIKVGDNVVVGANSVVVKDCPPNSVVAGVPAKVIKDARRAAR